MKRMAGFLMLSLAAAIVVGLIIWSAGWVGAVIVFSITALLVALIVGGIDLIDD